MERDSKVWIETGTSRFGNRNCRGDGCSTVLFSELASYRDAKFYSIDIDSEACKRSRDSI